MSDNLKIRQPQDPTKINVHEDWEVRYWCQKWNITADTLRNAVKVVGTATEAVRRHLGK